MEQKKIKTKIEKLSLELDKQNVLFNKEQRIERLKNEFLYLMMSTLSENEIQQYILNYCNITQDKFEQIKNEEKRELDQEENKDELKLKQIKFSELKRKETYLKKMIFITLLQKCSEKYPNQDLRTIKKFFCEIFKKMQNLTQEMEKFSTFKDTFIKQNEQYLQQIGNGNKNQESQNLINELKEVFNEIHEDLKTTLNQIEIEETNYNKLPEKAQQSLQLTCQTNSYYIAQLKN